MKSILKRIRYIKIILNLITIYLSAMSFTGISYAFLVIEGYKFPVEMLSYKYFFSMTSTYSWIIVPLWIIWIICDSIYSGNCIYLKPEIVEINYLHLEKDEITQKHNNNDISDCEEQIGNV